MSNILKIISSAPLSAKFGMLVVLIYSIVAIFAPFIAPYVKEKFLEGLLNYGQKSIP